MNQERIFFCLLFILHPSSFILFLRLRRASLRLRCAAPASPCPEPLPRFPYRLPNACTEEGVRRDSRDWRFGCGLRFVRGCGWACGCGWASGGGGGAVAGVGVGWFGVWLPPGGRVRGGCRPWCGGGRAGCPGRPLAAPQMRPGPVGEGQVVWAGPQPAAGFLAAGKAAPVAGVVLLVQRLVPFMSRRVGCSRWRRTC
jgi:hypothetical protein